MAWRRFRCRTRAPPRGRTACGRARAPGSTPRGCGTAGSRGDAPPSRGACRRRPTRPGAPAHRSCHAFRVIDQPAMWNSGNMHTVPPASSARRFGNDRRKLVRCDSTTPFERPVLPLVKKMTCVSRSDELGRDHVVGARPVGRGEQICVGDGRDVPVRRRAAHARRRRPGDAASRSRSPPRPRRRRAARSPA